MSQRAPGYRFQYQVPPTSSASSNATAAKPALRRRCRRYRPAKPAPTTATSTCCVLPLLVASEADCATIASGMQRAWLIVRHRVAQADAFSARLADIEMTFQYGLHVLKHRIEVAAIG